MERKNLAERSADWRAALVASMIATTATGTAIMPEELLGETRASSPVSPADETHAFLAAMGAVKVDRHG